MKAPEKVVLAFDPEKSDLLILHNRVGKILWCCIKYQHLAGESFNRDVQYATSLVDQTKPENYTHFKDIIHISQLNIYGTIGNCHNHILDPEFWEKIWKYITGEEKLKITISSESKDAKENKNF